MPANRHANVRFLHLGVNAAEALAVTCREDVGTEAVAGTWVRVPELVAALHVEAELDPAAAPALLAVARGLATTAVQVANKP